MRTSTLLSAALVAFSQLSAVSAAVNPSKVAIRSPQSDDAGLGKQRAIEFPKPDAITSQGCFSKGGNFTKQKQPDFFSSGSCGELCVGKKFAVMALHGVECLCGTHYPPEDAVVKDSNCDFPCPGYDVEACGSLGKPGHWSVFNTGLDLNAEHLPDEDEDEDGDGKKDSSSTSTSSSSTVAESTTAETAPASTQTEDDGEQDPENKDEEKSGPNTAAIAAGVVVGVVVIAGAIGGFFFWMRRRRNAEIEEDHRRNAAVNAFINGSKPPSSHGSVSMTDSRLDPVMAHRRMSDGSIADNQDYSRRILRVTNA